LTDPRLADVDHEVVAHGRVSSVEEAAERRGLPVSSVIKSIVVRRAEGEHVFVLVPGDRVIDWAKLRTHLGERRLSMTDADEALAITGYVRGTITPLGSSSPLPVVVDRLLASGPVSIGAGAAGVSVTLGGESLVRILEAEVADVTKPRG
jgi:Cys-tRNA(Pro) deacylase